MPTRRPLRHHTLTNTVDQPPRRQRYRLANLIGLISQQLILHDFLQALPHFYIDTSIAMKQQTCPCQKLKQAAKDEHQQDKFMDTAAFILTSVIAPTCEITLKSLAAHKLWHKQPTTYKEMLLRGNLQAALCAKIFVLSQALPCQFSICVLKSVNSVTHKLYQDLLCAKTN